LSVAFLRAAREQRAALGRAERREHQHVGRLGAGGVVGIPDQVAAVGRSERPRELDLSEAEERRYRPWAAIKPRP
jgi:hypothetical protein